MDQKFNSCYGIERAHAKLNMQLLLDLETPHTYTHTRYIAPIWRSVQTDRDANNHYKTHVLFIINVLVGPTPVLQGYTKERGTEKIWQDWVGPTLSVVFAKEENKTTCFQSIENMQAGYKWEIFETPHSLRGNIYNKRIAIKWFSIWRHHMHSRTLGNNSCMRQKNTRKQAVTYCMLL